MANKYEQIISEISNLSVLEVSELIKGLEEKFGVSAAMPAMAAAPAAAAAPSEAKKEEKSEYKVELVEAGADKIKAIKAVRAAFPTLTLTDAKNAVENAPAVLAEAASKDVANKAKETLEAAGAKVKLS